MTVEEAKNKRSDISLEGKIEEKGEARTVNTKYGETQVCDSYIVDATGRIKLTLWGDDAEKIKNGDTVSIQGAYTTTFRNEVQLNVPKKNGKLEVISSDGDCDGDDKPIGDDMVRPMYDNYGDKKVNEIKEESPGWSSGYGGGGSGIANKDQIKR